MKKISIIFLIFLTIFFCGFKNKEKPYVLLSSSYANIESMKRIERVFSCGQRIYYTVVVPAGFKYSGMRMQISSQNEKTSNWGFSIIQSNDISIVKSDQIYRNYIVIQRPGKYIIQFFYLNNKRYPFIHKEFFVQ